MEPVLRGKAITLLDLLLRPETSVTAWQRELVETEHMLADLYRQAFRNGSIRFILRRTGNIFLAGEGESGSATAAMLVCSTVTALNPPSVGTTTTAGDNNNGDSANGAGTGVGGASGNAPVAGTRSGAGSNAASVKSGAVSVNSAGAKSASASGVASAASGKGSLTKKNSEMLGDDAQVRFNYHNTPCQILRFFVLMTPLPSVCLLTNPLITYHVILMSCPWIVQAQRDKETSEMAELDKMRDELQMLLVAMLVRMARR